jgi:murein DD-endopeptidase MepM/ murein hydrolase activator NlpD
MRRDAVPAVPVRSAAAALVLVLLCLGAAPAARAQGIHLPPLPDSSGWGVHILALARAPDGALWVGTYGEGIFVLRAGARAWEHLESDTTGHSISMDFVHAFAFGPRGAVWYGTVGNGWGVSTDSGRTWRNWQFRELGPKWQYVAPNGIVVVRDTAYIATADGIRYSGDLGATWNAVTDSGPGALPSRYVLAVAAARDGGLWVATLRGVGQWRAGGRYERMDPQPVPTFGARIRAIFMVNKPMAVVPVIFGGERCAGGLRPKRRQEPAQWQCMNAMMRDAPPEGRAVRALAGCDDVLCAGATSSGALILRHWVEVGGAATARARDVYAVLPPATGQAGDTLFGTACGFLGAQPPACLTPGDTAGVRAPEPPHHSWFARPIALTDQPFVDQTYRYGSTMGGFFQQHQGVEFNDPTGTPVHALDGGVVVHAGPAEQGALVVAIRHDSTLQVPGEPRPRRIYSVYFHNSRLLVAVGQRVQRGQPVSLVGSTGRATNDHLHLEVHVAPTDSVGAIVGDNRYPPYTTNPELWIEPLPGTGIVAGQVWDARGRPVPQRRIYGLVKPEPQETPFAYAETYGARTRGTPDYQEHFAVSDVPPGDYVLGTEVDGRKLFRRVRVEAGKLTWVEFRP